MTVPQPQQQALVAPERLPGDVILSLERASLKIPFEEARRYSRANQRILEKDLPALLSAYNDRTSKGASADAGLEQRFQDRLAQLADRADQNFAQEMQYLRRLEYRQDYLDRLLRNTGDQQHYSDYMEHKLRRLVVEYHLDSGNIEFAQQMIPELGVEKWIDMEVYSDRIRILSEMRNDGSFQSALQWCSDNRQSLKKTKSTLEFALRRQEMIEMACRGNVVEAIAYGKRHLFSWLDSDAGADADADASNGDLWRITESAMGIIITGNHEAARQSFEHTVNLFKTEYNQMYYLDEPNMLLTVVKAGLIMVKTPNCGDPDFFDINCPACQPELSAIAAGLPYAHHDNSVLVCRITGERMDEYNPPRALPNGNVYSLKGLRKYAGDGAAHAKCPRTGAEFPWDELRRVYIT